MATLDTDLANGILKCLASSDQQEYSLKSIGDSLQGRISSHRLVELLEIMIKSQQIKRIRRGFYKMTSNSISSVNKENSHDTSIIKGNIIQRSKGLQTVDVNIASRSLNLLQTSSEATKGRHSRPNSQSSMKCLVSSADNGKKRSRAPISKEGDQVTLADHVHAFGKKHSITLG